MMAGARLRPRHARRLRAAGTRAARPLARAQRRGRSLLRAWEPEAGRSTLLQWLGGMLALLALGLLAAQAFLLLVVLD